MRNRRYPPKLKEILLRNAQWLTALDAGRNLEITQQAQRMAAEAARPKRMSPPKVAQESGSKGGKARAARVLEAEVVREISAITFDGKLWRNNRGSIRDGDRFIKYGVGPNGASDFIGYVEIEITPAMVGQRFARFVAIEAKRPGENAREDQSEFIEDILEAGGVAGVAHSGDEAREIIGATE